MFTTMQHKMRIVDIGPQKSDYPAKLVVTFH